MRNSLDGCDTVLAIAFCDCLDIRCRFCFVVVTKGQKHTEKDDFLPFNTQSHTERKLNEQTR